LNIALAAPSGVNLQPWEFYVVKGKALDALKRANLEEYRKGKAPEPELPVGATKGVAPALEGVYRERQVALAIQIFKIMGISKGDKEKQEEWMESMIQFYHAPAVIIIVVDKMLQGGWPVLDIGFVAQNILLAAQEFGLGTCVMRAIVDRPDKIRKIVNIPESKRIIVGISIGYPDWDHPINGITTGREKLDKILTLVE
jgi:nitroreductase